MLPAVTDTREAADPDAPLLFEEAGSNVVVDGELGDAAATAAAFARAAHVVKFDTWVQRVTGVPMEPRAAVAEFDPDTGRHHALCRQRRRVAAQGRSRHHSRRAAGPGARHHARGRRQFRHPRHDLCRVRPCRLGGAAARRPVKWTGERHESFLCDYQARDLAVTAELALDADGNFLAMRGSNISNAGGHTTNYSPLQKGVEIMTTIYRIPAAHFRARAVVSNTSPTRALSQRRPARGHVCHGTADRPRLPRARLRPRRDPAPQSRRPTGFPTRTRSA